LAKTVQAKRFARAVFELARESNKLDQWSQDLAKITMLAQNTDLVAVLENPGFIYENKRKLLDNQLLGINPLAMNLSYILTGQGQFHLISKVYIEYERLLDEFRSIAKAEITTAVPLDEEERIKLAARLGAITGKKIVILEKVDPTIIGGMIARVEGKIIDGSTRTQLEALKRHLAGAVA
jgi:F-type H+-transporting ATPase subunit delta